MRKLLLILLIGGLLFLPVLATGQMPGNRERPEINIGYRYNGQTIDSLITAATDIGRRHVDSGLAMLQALIPVCKNLNDNKRLANVYTQMAYLNVMIADNPNQGITYLQRSRLYHEHSEKKEDTAWLIEWHKNMGIAQFLNSQMDSAMIYYTQGLQLVKGNGASQAAQKVDIMLGISTLLLELKDDQKAGSYIQQAILICKKYGLHERLLSLYQNQSWWYLKNDRIDSAKYYINQTKELKLKQSLNSNASNIDYLSQKGILYSKLKKDREALKLFKKALDLSQSEDRNYYSNLSNVAELYLNLGELNNAGKYLRQLSGKLKRPSTDREKIQVYIALQGNLSRYYDSLGDYRSALRHLLLQKQYADTFHKMELDGMVHRLETSYRTSEKDKQLTNQRLQLAQNESRLLKNRTWMIIVLLCAVFIILFLIIRYRNKQKLARKNLENMQQSHEIERLQYKTAGEETERSRIARELHDGVSVLLTATQMTYSALGKEHRDIATSETYKEVSGLLQRTSREVRAIAHNLIPDLLIQESLPSAIKSFCDLIQKRHQLKIALQVYGSFSRKDKVFNHAVYRIIQELIHNTVKHARASLVRLQMTLHNGLLQITVEDDGVGFQQDHSSAGMGMANLQARVKEMKGELTFTSAPNKGTVVEIEIPYLIKP